MYNGVLLSCNKEWNSTMLLQQRYCLYVEYKKYNQLVNITKKQPTHRYREQSTGYRGGGDIGVREWGTQILRCKIGSRMLLYNTGNITNILQ